MTEFLIWYFNLDFWKTILFAFQAMVLMILIALPFVVSRLFFRANVIKALGLFETTPSKKSSKTPPQPSVLNQ